MTAQDNVVAIILQQIIAYLRLCKAKTLSVD